MNTQTNPPEGGPQETPLRALPEHSRLQILINWLVLTLGLGGVAALGAILPEFL